MGTCMRKTVVLFACPAALIAVSCAGRARVLTYEQAGKMGPLENIVGYKNAARYRTCKQLYVDIARILADSSYAQRGPKECPKATSLAHICDLLPDDTPEQQAVRARVAQYIEPLPCTAPADTNRQPSPGPSPRPAILHASLKAGKPPAEMPSASSIPPHNTDSQAYQNTHTQETQNTGAQTHQNTDIPIASTIPSPTDTQTPQNSGAQAPQGADMHSPQNGIRAPQNADIQTPQSTGGEPVGTGAPVDQALRDYLRTHIQFARARSRMIDALSAYRTARGTPDAAAAYDQLKTAWATCLELLDRGNNAFAQLSQNIFKESIEKESIKLLIIDLMLRSAIEAALKNR